MKRILVVDDEPNIRLLYREILNEDGYEVLEAESSTETFQTLNREPIDLVILDIKLRSESGLNILQRMIREYPNTAVVLCSAYSSFQDDYKSWLADSYIIKSSDPEELLREVRNVLQKRGNTE